MFVFYKEAAPTEIYSLPLHTPLPIFGVAGEAVDQLDAHPLVVEAHRPRLDARQRSQVGGGRGDRKSTRLNSSHANISYDVFCLKKIKSFPHTLISTLLNYVSVIYHI